MFKKSLYATIFSTLLIALPITASAAELLCSSSIQFDPEEVTINRENPTLIPVLMTQIASGDIEMCNYSFKLFDPEYNTVGSNINPDSIIDTTDGILTINFEKNDFLAKEMKKDGTYTLEIYDTKDNSLKGTLDINIMSGSVLGASHQRGENNALYIVLALVVMAGGVGIYVAKQR